MTAALTVLLAWCVGVASSVVVLPEQPAVGLGALLGAVAVGWLESFSVLKHYQKVFEIIGGVLLILSGLYMLNAYFFVLPELAA